MPASIVVKEIKPQRFNVKAFYDAIKAEADRTASEMKKDFEATTATWEHKPSFEKIVDMVPGPQILVGTDDKIYTYVSEGTRPHLIFPKKAGRRLSFQWGGKGSYKAKTKPRVIGSAPGGPTGPKVALPYVQHPGTEARKFDEVIEKKWQGPFKRRMEKAMSDASRASGHAI